MKFINPLCSIIILVVSLAVAYADLAMGNDRVIGDQYTVKINNVLFRRDVAEGLLFRIKDECKCSSIPAYDNIRNRNIMLSEIEENMDVSTRDSELLSKLADMYKDLKLNGANVKRIKDMTCIDRRLNFNKIPTKIKICADEDGIIIYLMIRAIGRDI